MEKVRLPVCDLRLCMFVAGLDRPWAETPFAPPGFKLGTAADLAAVRKHCQFVHIDMRQTEAVEVTIGEHTVASFLAEQGAAMPQQDLHSASAIGRQTAELIKAFLEGICLGRSPDIQLAKSAVAECVAAVVGKPEAMMLLSRLRGKDLLATQQSVNVCINSIVLGLQLGLTAAKLEELGVAALLHDVGLLGIPDYLLNKPGRLDGAEMAVMQSHAKRGRDILLSGRATQDAAADVAYAHHEHLDGTGYPRGLEAGEISLCCRIVAVVDKYEGLITARAYRPALDHLGAVSALRKLAKGGKIDSAITNTFVANLGIYPPGSIVELNSGEVGIVLESNAKQPLRPQILVVRDPARGAAERVVDMAKKTADYRIASVGSAAGLGVEVGQYYEMIQLAYG
ncbi:MAG: HD-GYP domain-containing protein [Candidatus Methylumidiphilus sp.]